MFIISPPGNGIDTQSLGNHMSGSYPVVEKNLSMNSFNEFPIIFVNNLSKISLKQIKSLKNNLNKFDSEILKVNYWMKNQ